MSGQSIGYIRVSSADQNIGRQEEGLSIYSIDRMFIDKITGSIKDRPQLALCIDYARDGDTLYIYSIDRLARNLSHLEQLVTRLTDKGVTVTFAKEHMSFNGDVNPMNRLMLQMMGAFAEFERTLIKERQREGIAHCKLTGKTKTGRPIGKPPLDMSRRDEAIELSKQDKNISEISRAMGLSRGSISKLLS